MMNYHEKLIHESLTRSIEKCKPNLRNNILASCEATDRMITKKKKSPYILRPIYAAAALYIIFLSIVNMIPAAALSLSQIPIIDKLVWSSVVDKSIFNALDNGYTQPINQQVEDKDIIFTIHDLVVGNKIHFLMSLSLPNDMEEKDIELVELDAEDQTGKALNLSYQLPIYDKESGAYVFGFDIFTFSGNVIEDIQNINISISSLKLNDEKLINGAWKISIPIQTDNVNEAIWQKELNYIISKEDGTSFTIEKIVSTSSDVAVYIQMSAAEARNAPRGLVILDDNGYKVEMKNSFAQKAGDITEFKYYFDAIYPNAPVKLEYLDGAIVKEITFK